MGLVFAIVVAALGVVHIVQDFPGALARLVSSADLPDSTKRSSAGVTS
jgi:hypothetical protein